MSADWEVGDLALCVRGGDTVYGIWTADMQVAPAPGSIHLIDRVRDFDGCLGLGSQDWVGFFEASRFVKVTPPAADEFDRETIELMNRKPVEALT